MNFSPRRIWAILVKEILQMRRDRLTLGMILGVPLMQLFLFGFAINLNPHDLPAAIAINDPGPLARSIVAGLATVRTSFDTVRAKVAISEVSGASYFRCCVECSPTMLTIGVRALRAL